MFIVEKTNPKRFCLNPWRKQIFCAVLTPASDFIVYTKDFLCMHSHRRREHRGLIFLCIVWRLRYVFRPDFRSNIPRSACSFLMFTGMPWLHLRLVVVPVLFPRNMCYSWASAQWAASATVYFHINPRSLWVEFSPFFSVIRPFSRI